MSTVTVDIGARNRTGPGVREAETNLKGFAARAAKLGESIKSALTAGGGADAGKKVGQFALELGRAQTSAEALGATLKGMQEIGGLGAWATAGLGVAGAFVAVIASTRAEIEKTDKAAADFGETLEKVLKFGDLGQVTAKFDEVGKELEATKARLKELDEMSGKGLWKYLTGSGLSETLKERERVAEGEKKQAEAGAKMVLLRQKDVNLIELEAEGQEAAAAAQKRAAELAKIKGDIEQKYTGNLKTQLLALADREAVAKEQIAATAELRALEAETLKEIDEQKKTIEETAKARETALAGSAEADKQAAAAFEARATAEQALATFNESALEKKYRLEQELADLIEEQAKGPYVDRVKRANEDHAALVKKRLDLLTAEKAVQTELEASEKSRADEAQRLADETERTRKEEEKINKEAKSKNISKHGMTGREKAEARRAAHAEARRLRKGARGDRRETSDILDDAITKGATPEAISKIKTDRVFTDDDGNPLKSNKEIEKAVRDGKMSAAEATARRNAITTGKLDEKSFKSGVHPRTPAQTGAQAMMKIGGQLLQGLSGIKLSLTTLGTKIGITSL